MYLFECELSTKKKPVEERRACVIQEAIKLASSRNLNAKRAKKSFAWIYNIAYFSAKQIIEKFNRTRRGRKSFLRDNSG